MIYNEKGIDKPLLTSFNMIGGNLMAKIQKRLILICAAVLMLVTLLLLAVTASAAAWNRTIASGFAGGSGSSADPYRISNGAELAYLADRVNGGEDFQGKYIALTADIDLGNVNWTPIGTYTNPFRGNFSGNVNNGTNKPVCTISNLKISGTENYQ